MSLAICLQLRTAGLGVLVSILLAGCMAAPPVQEMSDARQAIAAAREAGAADYAAADLGQAQARLADAERNLQAGTYRMARRSALAARERAVDALLRSRERRAGDITAPGAVPDTVQ